MLTADELQRALDQCFGSVLHYRHASGMRFSEGIRTLMIQGKCHWLIDMISGFQSQEPFNSDTSLKAFQVWVLEVQDNEGLLCCFRDRPEGSEPVVTRRIRYTEFALSRIKLYVCDSVILLPSEY